MINVYDWFESFQVALEGQREHLKSRKQVAEKVNASGGSGSGSPKRRGPAEAIRKAKIHERGKGGKEEAPADQPDEDPDVEDEEQWKLQVQTRFIRALHELDYLGFIKHTGRKADHVIRTVFDVGD